MTLVINYRSDEAGGVVTLRMIRGAGSDGEVMRCDASDAVETKRALDEVVSRFERIEVLVNNAGITSDGLFVLMSEDEWDSVIDTSLKGFYHVTRPVLEKMISNKRGSVVSIASVSGLSVSGVACTLILNQETVGYP